MKLLHGSYSSLATLVSISYPNITGTTPSSCRNRLTAKVIEVLNYTSLPPFPPPPPHNHQDTSAYFHQ